MKTTQYKWKFLESKYYTRESYALKDAATLDLGNLGGTDRPIVVHASWERPDLREVEILSDLL